MRATYRNDREAAHAAAEALRRENDELRVENDYLRSLVDPLTGAGAHNGAQFQGALAATALLLGAMAGATLGAREARVSSVSEVAEAPASVVEALAVRPSPEVARALGAPVAVDALGPTAAPLVATEPPAVPLRLAALRDAVAPTLGALSACQPGTPAGFYATLHFALDGRVGQVVLSPRHRASMGEGPRQCVTRALRDVSLESALATPARARLRFELRDGAVRLRWARW